MKRHYGNGIWPERSLSAWLYNHRPHCPRRDHAARDETPPPPEPGGVLAAFRVAALWAIALLIFAASAAAFAESYRGLLEWAQHHRLAGIWAVLFPLQVDVFIAVGELVLFVAMVDRWRRRDRLGAWALSLVGLAVSVGGNIGHLGAADLQSRGTAAVPPVAAFAALWLGLAVVKRIIVGRKRPDETVRQDAPGEAPEEPGPEEAGEVPPTAEDAAEASLRATLAAGNPWSVNQLQTRFGLKRSAAADMRRRVVDGTEADADAA